MQWSWMKACPTGNPACRHFAQRKTHHYASRISLSQSPSNPSLHQANTSTQRRAVATRATYYELLGLTPEASDEDIKQAFRRMAREVHPDVNKEDGADQLFIQCKEAYETLSDLDRRREYDRLHRLGRRIGFFQDVVEPARPDSPFRWSHVGADPDRGRGRAPWEPRPGATPPFDDRDEEDEEDEEEEAGPGSRDGDEDPEQRLRDLFRFMDGGRAGPGGLRQWQSGGNPWGTSSSDMWRQQVDQQTRDPFGRSSSGSGFQSGRPPVPGGPEWTPPGRHSGDEDDFMTKRQGWAPPGRSDEWRPPRRQDEGDDDLPPGGPGRGPPGRGRRGWGDDGGFRGKPL